MSNIGGRYLVILLWLIMKKCAWKCFRKDNCDCVWSSDSDLMASGGDDKRVLCRQLVRAVTATIPGYQPAIEQCGKKQPVKRCSQNSMKEHYELREKESLHVFFRYIYLRSCNSHGWLQHYISFNVSGFQGALWDRSNSSEGSRKKELKGI